VQVGREWNVPVVLTEHVGPFSLLLRSQSRRSLVQQTVNGAQRLLAVSPALAQEIQDTFPGVTVGVLGNVIRTDFFTPVKAGNGDAHREKTICTVALLSPGKGIEVLLEAVRILRERGQDRFRVIIGGDGPERRRLEDIVASNALQRFCQFTGLLDRDGVRALLRRSDIFVLPSLGESFGVALGEAMACGKYVIATRCGGPEFVIAPGSGVLVEKGDAVQLADALEKALDGSEAGVAMRARESIDQRFGPDAFLENVSSIYASMQ
jgi:glycosyltransferase involved in cell wall biosynthesis